MIRVATWSATGPNAGRVVPLRTTTHADRRWRVVVRWRRPLSEAERIAVAEEAGVSIESIEDEQVEHVYTAEKPCPLISYFDAVMEKIGDAELPEGTLVESASIEIFMPSKPTKSRH